MRKTTIVGLVFLLTLALFTAGCGSETTQVDDVAPSQGVDTNTASDPVDEPVVEGFIDESDEVEIGEMI